MAHLFITRSKKLTAVLSAAMAISIPFLHSYTSSALTGNDFNAGNIISGAVFTDTTAMSAQDIQNFLNAKIPTCDTNGAQPTTHPNGSGGYYNRAQWGAVYDSTNNTTIGAAPYVCLKSYVENPSNGQSNLQNPSLSVPGGQTAAQIIYNTAQTYTINPEVLLTTLQKEQGLVTDDWPWLNEYRSAMGYNCPDNSSGCSGYAGFYQQVDAAAKQYRNYLNNPNNFNYVVGTNTVNYSVPPPYGTCSSSTSVTIQNQATAALYDYTPYTPDGSVLANTNPTGSANGAGGAINDNCASYGNRNFWWYFTTWFGSTQTTIPYAWSFISTGMYADSRHNLPFSNSTINITPGSQAYLEVTARNNGNLTWDQSTLHLGTSNPGDRTSVFSDTSWLSGTRIKMVQSSVAPGDIGTFDFSITAPQKTGSYNEYFSPVADGKMWLNDPGMYFLINVVSPRAGTRSNDVTLSANQTIAPGQYLMSADGSTTLQLDSNGALHLNSNARLTWDAGAIKGAAKLLVMQPDGNLVEYAQSGGVLWNSHTSGNPNSILAVQPDGNMVIYSSAGTAIWSTTTSNTPNYYLVPFYNFSGGTLLPGQAMNTAAGNYHLELQPDGNLVLYNGGRPLWATGTSGMSIANLSMQPDGNLVLYNTAGKAVWSSGTAGHYNAMLALQPDGNLVLYNQSGSAAWDTRTEQ